MSSSLRYVVILHLIYHREGEKLGQRGQLFQKLCGSALNLGKASLELKIGSLPLGCRVVAESGAESLTLPYNKASQPQDLKLHF